MANNTKEAEHISDLLAAERYQDIIDLYPITQLDAKEYQILTLVAWAWTMQGVALNKQAQATVAKHLDSALGLWEQATQKYEQAIHIDLLKHEAFYNWGIVLANMAEAIVNEQPERAFDLWRHAGEKYCESLRIKPDKDESLHNWGCILDNQALTLVNHDPQAAQALWTKAGEKYQAALAINPDKTESLSNWAAVLLYQYHLATTTEKQTVLLNKAEGLLQHAVQLDAVAPAYNMACVYALKGNAEAAVIWLEKSHLGGALEPKNHIEIDQDLDNIRHSEIFQNWFNKTFADK